MARPAKFTLAQIQREALALVDRDGLAGLTMRSLAAALHTGPMTLYNYVDGREALEELVVDAVAAEAPPVSVSSDWPRISPRPRRACGRPSACIRP